MASEAKKFLLAQKIGLLSSHSLSYPGYPFGSLLPYDVNQNAEIFIYISLIAEHYKNLGLNSKASLTVIDSVNSDDPQANARLTLLLDFKPVSAAEKQVVKLNYETKFPNSVPPEIADNFVFFKGTIHKARWIGGFGKMCWLAPEKFN